jgi:hypothetical protein
MRWVFLQCPVLVLDVKCRDLLIEVGGGWRGGERQGDREHIDENTLICFMQSRHYHLSACIKFFFLFILLQYQQARNLSSPEKEGINEVLEIS